MDKTMNNPLVKLLVKFLLPVVLVVIISLFNIWLGLLWLFVYIGIIIYNRRAGLLAYIGKVAFTKGDSEKALLHFRQAIRTGKATLKTKTEYGYLMLRTGNAEKANEVFKNLLGTKLSDDEKSLVKSNMALVLWKTGLLDDAISLLEEIFPNYKTTTVYGSYGYLLILKGDLEKALAFNLEAYSYNNSNSIILDNLAQTYYLTGENDKALEIFEKLMLLNPTFPEAYYNYALALAKKGDLALAFEFSQKALGYRLSFLSTISRDEIETKAEEFKLLLEQSEKEKIESVKIAAPEDQKDTELKS